MSIDRKKLGKAALIALGAVFLFVGFIGLFFPVLQGILFIAIGLYILSIASECFKSWLDRRLIPFPRVKAHIDRQHERVTRFLARFRRG